MSDRPTWEVLMVEAQSGNASAYNALLSEVSDYLRSYLKYRVRGVEASQDLLQEILISLHRARHTYDSKYPVKPWLFKIVQSRLIDHYRKTGSSELAMVRDEEFMGNLVAEAEVSQIEMDELKTAINGLSEDQRKVLCAIKFEGKSVRDVSRELAMSEAAVKVTAHRAYKLLFERLELEP